MSDTEHKSQTQPGAAKHFVFPRWSNYLLPGIALGVLGSLFYLPTLVGFGASPRMTAVGYAPPQPVPYSHALHAGKLGLDCRYCHYTVEKTAFASIPPTQVCMNCHNENGILPKSENLVPVQESWQTGRPIGWVKVHDLPDYAYFNHSAHVSHGVGCVTCHGRVDQMDVVTQQTPLSMGWCVECHRAPEQYLRPVEQVTNMSWQPDGDQVAQGLELKKKYGIRDAAYMTSCYTCHR